MKRNSFMLENGMYLSFTVALVAMIGSLFFSEVRQFPPCTYCWYSRILMYPLVLILGIAAVRKDWQQTIYVLPLSGLGVLMAGYHYMTQKIPALSEATGSCGIIPCNTEYINWLGFITIPFLALTAFILIFILQLILWKAARNK